MTVNRDAVGEAVRLHVLPSGFGDQRNHFERMHLRGRGHFRRQQREDPGIGADVQDHPGITGERGEQIQGELVRCPGTLAASPVQLLGDDAPVRAQHDKSHARHCRGHLLEPGRGGQPLAMNPVSKQRRAAAHQGMHTRLREEALRERLDAVPALPPPSSFVVVDRIHRRIKR